MLDTVRAKPKPFKVPKKKKESVYCKCKYLFANRENFKLCGKCRKQIPAKKYRKALENAADAVLKAIVLLRDGFCVCPAPSRGHGSVRQPGHLISRTKKSVKYDLRNVNEQCDSCNILHENYAERYNNWYVNRFGMESYNALCADGEVTVDLSVDDLENLLNNLSGIYQCQLNEKSFRPRFSQKEILSGEWRRGLRPD